MHDAAYTPSSDDSEAEKNRRRVVFISYKHEDEEIAKTIADHLNQLASEKLDLVVYSHHEYKGAAFGGSLTEEIARQLLVTEVFFFVYTGKSKDYSWCMYEAGLATDPKSLKGTRIIVFSLVDDVPTVFEGKNVVKAKQVGQLQKLLSDFCVQADFFPGGRGPLFEDNDIIRDAASEKAKKLHYALNHKFVLDERREVPRWPSLVVEMSKENVERFVEIVEAKGDALLFDNGQTTEEVDFFLQNAEVIHSEEGGSKVFDFTWQERTGVPLRQLRQNWLTKRKIIAIRQDLPVANNRPWDLVLAREVYKICKNMGPSLDWSPFLDLEDPSKWLYPLISTSFINPDGSREFRIRIVPFLAPGVPVPGE